MNEDFTLRGKEGKEGIRVASVHSVRLDNSHPWWAMSRGFNPTSFHCSRDQTNDQTNGSLQVGGFVEMEASGGVDFEGFIEVVSRS